MRIVRFMQSVHPRAIRLIAFRLSAHPPVQEDHLLSSNRKRQLMLLPIAIAVVGGLVTPSAASLAQEVPASEDRSTASDRPECRKENRLPERAALDSAGGPSPDVPAFAQWSWTAEVDAALNRIGALIHADEALMGLQKDHVGRRIEVTHSSDLTPAELQAKRQDVAAAARGSVAVILTPSCFTSSEVRDAKALVLQGDWVTQAFGMVVSYRPDDGRVHVGIPASASADGERLRELAGDVVAIEYYEGELGRASGRTADENPRYAGANIVVGEFPYGTACTSGFNMMVNGVKYGTTAGHCAAEEGKEGAHVYNGIGQSYGYIQNYGNGFNPDFALLRAGSQGYTNKIYTDPGSPTTRTVTTATVNGAMNFCLSGAVTKAVCGMTTENLDATLCDEEWWIEDAGCTPHLYEIKYEYPGYDFMKKGDSGGPAYGRIGTSSADARGMIIGDAQIGSSIYGYLHNVGSMKGASGGGYIMTSP